MYNKEHWKADPTLFFTPLSMMNRNHTLCRHLYVVCRNRNMNVLQKYSILYQYPQTFQTSVNSNFLWSFLGPTKRIFACINIHNLMYLHDRIQFFYCPFIYWFCYWFFLLIISDSESLWIMFISMYPVIVCEADLYILKLSVSQFTKC